MLKCLCLVLMTNPLSQTRKVKWRTSLQKLQLLQAMADVQCTQTRCQQLLLKRSESASQKSMPAFTVRAFIWIYSPVFKNILLKHWKYKMFSLQILSLLLRQLPKNVSCIYLGAKHPGPSFTFLFTRWQLNQRQASVFWSHVQMRNFWSLSQLMPENHSQLCRELQGHVFCPTDRAQRHRVTLLWSHNRRVGTNPLPIPYSNHPSPLDTVI